VVTNFLVVKTKALIARAVLKIPIMMDEATSALDTE
jgi:ABC-type multidrug transport system fused ATPase/permease subunit